MLPSLNICNRSGAAPTALHTTSSCLCNSQSTNSHVYCSSRLSSTKYSPSSHARRRFEAASLASADVETATRTNGALQGPELPAARPAATDRNGHSQNPERSPDAPTADRQSVEKVTQPPAKDWQRNGRPTRQRWDNGNRQNSFNRRQTHGNKLRGPVKDFPYKVGDVVIGKVVGGQYGWRVALEHDENILGFCPQIELPQVLKSIIDEPDWQDTKIGLRRPFQIRVIPEDMEYNGKGPLLSARAVDLDALWTRAQQIMDVCAEDGEVITIHINKLNHGGCLGIFEGLPVFVPFSHVPRMPNGGIKDRETMAATYVGKDLEVSIVDVRRKNNRFVGNVIKALQSKAFHSLKVGDLVWGFVNAVENYGAFITLDEQPSVRGLLHIGAISRAHVNSMNGLFHVGEKVRSLVVGMDSRNYRVSLSTAELEPESGDMLFNKATVYQHAEENVADFRQWMIQRQKDIDSGDVELEELDDSLDWKA